MITIGDKIIDTSIWEILLELKDSLFIKGIDKLKDMTPKGDNIRITCPSHKGGKEDHPSCSVLTVKKLRQGKKGEIEEIPEGSVTCFTCGYRASFPQFVADCFGQSLEWAEDWILDKFNYSVTQKMLQFNFLRLNEEKEVESEQEDKHYVTEDVLEALRIYHPYMWQRKLTPQIVDKFDIGYNKEKNAISFPVYDDKGCLFIVYRFVKPWGNMRFEIPEDIDKEIFGLNHITPDMDTVVICEAVFDALTCWVHGVPAVALFGTGSKEQIDTLKSLHHVKHYILGFDNDPAGKKATKKFRAEFSKNKIVTSYILPKNKKDINELTEEEFNNLQQI